MASKKDRFPASERTWVIQAYGALRPDAPPTDIIEQPDRLLVQLEIAGMRGSEFNIVLLDHHLVISGVRERPTLTNAAYHQLEINYGEFRVDIALPYPIDRDSVSAAYDDGFLQISLPRQAAQQVHIKNQQTQDKIDDKD